MLLRGRQCRTEERILCYGGEDSVILRRGECVTVERRVCY